tara:strand:+ start:451 stop:1140 length:690 start_codon:yes stop_codon:yes gene_type:complete
MIEVLILCGGLGTRYNTSKKKYLKPLVKIGNEYLIKKIMKIYTTQADCKFFLLGGYKYNYLKSVINKNFKNFNVEVLNTGLMTNTAGRLKIASKYIANDTFCVTYGDSLANFNLLKCLKLKKKNNIIINVYEYDFEYGLLNLDKNRIKSFDEKKKLAINGGFYILDKDIFKFIKSKSDSFEAKTLPKILKTKKKLICQKVTKWHPMDTIQNKKKLEIIIKKDKNYFLKK